MELGKNIRDSIYIARPRIMTMCLDGTVIKIWDRAVTGILRLITRQGVNSGII